MKGESTSMEQRRKGNGPMFQPSPLRPLVGVLLSPLYLALWLFAKVFKRVPNWLLRKLLRDWHRTNQRRPDVRIPGDHTLPSYMLRWWRIPRNRFLNVYYHHVLRSDDDRALHDHPWFNFSIVLEGGYYEHTVEGRQWYPAGSVRFRGSGKFAHRLELEQAKPIAQSVAVGSGEYIDTSTFGGEYPDGRELPVKTIFITGPVVRRWGFLHEERWVDAYEWDDFCQERGLGGMRMSGYAQQNEKRK